MPTASDLVTDLPADFETFGQAVATSMADLLGGTTGQVLSKASNTDMDFTWVAQDDSNAIQNAIVDAKGDLIAASAADTPARLAVGTNGQVLTADSTASTGLVWSTPSPGMSNPLTTTGDTIYSSSGSTPARLGIGSNGNVLTVAGGVPTWAAPAGGGKVLQVVSATTTTSTTIATTTMTDTTITATITPTLASSKILVILNGTLKYSRGSTYQGVGANLLRNGTNIAAFGNENAGRIEVGNSTTVAVNSIFSLNYLDNPATTSATTYKLQAKVLITNFSGSSTWQDGSTPSTITLLEIGV
jgi:hypothetical protein